MSNRSKVDHERLLIPVDDILPSPENSELYRPVTSDDDATIALADSIGLNGILEPIVISADNYIISGHRRHCGARIAGLREVPCRNLKIRRGKGETASDEFLKLLREHNRQRVKSRDEFLRAWHGERFTMPPIRSRNLPKLGCLNRARVFRRK
jgi:hypothetical protein